MANNNKLEIQQFVQVSEEKQLQTVREKNYALIEKTTKQYYEIDVAEAMTKLAMCGQLIQLAYSASDGFPCQAKVVLLLSKYGTLVKNSYLATTKFVTASMGALKFHKVALKILAKSPEKATKFICKCSDLAGQMAKVAADLSNQAATLEDIAAKALGTAVEDKSISTEKEEEMKEMIKKAKADAEALEATTKGLATTIQEVRQQEAAAIKEASGERDDKFCLNIIKTLVAPVTAVNTSVIQGLASWGALLAGNQDNDDNDDLKENDKKNDKDDDKKNDKDNKGKTASDRAYLLTKEKYDLQRQAIEENAKLAKTVASLRGFKESENTLQQALASIEIAIKTLGKIKVIFSNTRIFWEGVQANCNRLVTIGGDIKLYAEDGEAEMFMDEIEESINDSALNWFTLCVVNYDAKKAIIQVDKKMDSILSDLPTKQEALQLVSKLTGELEESLAIENEKLAASNEQIKAIEN